MAKKEFPIPKEYKKDVEDIHGEMLKVFTEDISTIPGEFAYDATRGSAEQIAMLREMMIHFLLMRAFTQTSDGEYLDLLGDMRAVWRKKATKSTGYVIFYGKPGTIIPKGTIVSTEASENVNSINFITLEMGEIENDYVKVLAECMTAGNVGNVKPSSVKVLVSEINDVSRVSNDEFKNGTDIEDDESLRDRVQMAEREEQLSGADVDYERWAKEVDGVGYAYCRETWNGPGTVKVHILDKNRKPASSELIAKVKEYIWPDLKSGQVNRGGKAPTGIKECIFDTPKIKNIIVGGDIVVSSDFDSKGVLDRLKTLINKYFDKIDIYGTISYNMVTSIIGVLMVNDMGVEDFSNVTLNGLKENIKLDSELASVTGLNINVTKNKKTEAHNNKEDPHGGSPGHTGNEHEGSHSGGITIGSMKITKVYPSIEAMNNDVSNLKDGEMALINTNNVEDEDNAKLFIKESGGLKFVVDLSGSRGRTVMPKFTIDQNGDMWAEY